MYCIRCHWNSYHTDRLCPHCGFDADAAPAVQAGQRARLTVEQHWLGIAKDRDDALKNYALSAVPAGALGAIYRYHDPIGWSAWALALDDFPTTQGHAYLLGTSFHAWLELLPG